MLQRTCRRHLDGSRASRGDLSRASAASRGMLSRFFHRWEQRLASATRDRVVRPFDWGNEWVDLAGPEGPALHEPEGPALHNWIDGIMGDTSAFFATPPTTDYDFDAARGELRFPSALTTPHLENNAVLARWFPASASLRPRNAGFATLRRGKPDKRGPAVVVLPQWNSDADGHIGLSRLLARSGVSALRLSLPYHDARMPPELTRADYIVSANIARTVQVCRQAVMDARRAVAWLTLQGYERISIAFTTRARCSSTLATI